MKSRATVGRFFTFLRTRRATSRLRPGALDYLLSGLCGVLAVFSGGMGIAIPFVGYFFAGLVSVGAAVGLGLGRSLAGTRLARFDGYLYFLLAVVSMVTIQRLNAFLPEGGFPQPLLVAGVLSWMIAFGSFVAWRDQTLIFQAVPCIALFGLVGVWDTFPGATALFFLFLVVLATLFARAHARLMLSQASDAGELRLEALREGPWRWAAGPEWAWVSAAIVVVISLVGAPLLQQSVQGVSGFVNISVPIRSQGSISTSANFSGNGDSLPVGQGPRNIRGIQILRAKMDVPRYLRGRAYTVYERGRWTQQSFLANPRFTPRGDEPGSVRIGSIVLPYDPSRIVRNAVEIPVSLLYDYGVHDRIYAPGEAWRLPWGKGIRMANDGTVTLSSNVGPGARIDFTVLVPPNRTEPVKVGMPPLPNDSLIEPLRNAGTIPLSVQRLGARIAAGKRTDFEKAEAIRSEIARRVVYNLAAPAAPEGRDPVDFVLFESRQAYCDVFASAMTLMARSVGLPARLATGFYPNQGRRDQQGYFLIRDADYHAWAEIYFDGFGWVPFDATSGARGTPGLSRGDIPQQPVPWYEWKWLQFTLIAIAAGLAVAAVAVAVRGLFAVRDPKGSPARSEAARLYGRFERNLARRAKRSRRSNETVAEYLAAIHGSLGASGSSAQGLARRFEVLLYGPAEPGKDAFRDLSSEVRAFRKMR